MVRAGQAVHKGKRRCRHNPFSTAPVSAIMRQTREVIRMGYIRRPAYYKAFRCIGSDCTENCCIGWEIDVDEDSLCVLRGRSRRFWRAFAREHCACGRADRRAGAFSSDAEERCPLLNDCNLCEVLLHLGEDKMAQICTGPPAVLRVVFGRPRGRSRLVL